MRQIAIASIGLTLIAGLTLGGLGLSGNLTPSTEAEAGTYKDSMGILRLKGVENAYSAKAEAEILSKFESWDTHYSKGEAGVDPLYGNRTCKTGGPLLLLSGRGRAEAIRLQYNPETCESIYVYGKVKEEHERFEDFEGFQTSASPTVNGRPYAECGGERCDESR